jgi:hypothetical protein
MTPEVKAEENYVNRGCYLLGHIVIKSGGKREVMNCGLK